MCENEIGFKGDLDKRQKLKYVDTIIWKPFSQKMGNKQKIQESE